MSKGAKVSKGLPAGFVEARTSLAGFFARIDKGQPGFPNAIQGILRGHFQVKGRFGEKRVHRIEITEGETIVGEGEVLTEGQIGLDESGFTKVLSDFEPGTVVYVRCNGIDKAKQKKGQSAPWDFTVAKYAGTE
jgi:hypothetical protein